MLALRLLMAASYFAMTMPSFASDTNARIQAILPEFSTQINKMLQDSHVPGVAVGIVYDNKIIYAQGFGVKDLEANQPINADTVFLVGSVSKPLTSATLAKLVSEGKVKWDDKVIQYLPNFELYDPWVTKEITIRDLLSHRSGLPTHSGDILEELGYTRAEIIQRLHYIKPVTSFRSRWDYQNAMFSVAGEIAAKVEGKDWGQVFKQVLLQPLAMNSTSGNVEDFINAKNKITCYHLTNNKPEKVSIDFNDALAPSGGASTTLNDMTHFMIMQLNHGKYNNKQIIKSEVLDETHAPQAVINKNPNYSDKYLFYGLGMVVDYDDEGNTYLQHSGAIDGIRSYMALIPQQKIGIVILANAFPNALPEAIAHTFFDLYFHNKIQRNWLEHDNKAFADLLKTLAAKPASLPAKNLNKKPSLPLTAYIGLYYNNYLGDAHVSEEQRKLVLELVTPRPKKFVLEPWNGDQFAIHNDEEINIVKFTINNAKVVSLLIDGFTKDVEPVFQHTSEGLISTK